LHRQTRLAQQGHLWLAGTTLQYLLWISQNTIRSSSACMLGV
jgi:hypothetical protein